MLLSKNVTGGGQNLDKNWQLPENKLFRKLIFKFKTNLQLLIRKIEKIWIESEEIPPSPPPSPKLKKKKAGTIVIEVVFTLPLVFYMVFFCVELIRINITNDALQTICEEATFLTSAHNYESGPDLIAKIDAIIEKHRPRFIPQKAPGYNNTPWPVIRYAFETYNNPSDALSTIPYGAPIATYPPYEHNVSGVDHSLHSSQGYLNDITNYVPILNMEYNANPQRFTETTNYIKGFGFPDGRVFVLTVSCNYPFSSSITKMLFNRGINTKIIASAGDGYISSSFTHQDGTMYLLYARGAGIVGKKK